VPLAMTLALPQVQGLRAVHQNSLFYLCVTKTPTTPCRWGGPCDPSVFTAKATPLPRPMPQADSSYGAFLLVDHTEYIATLRKSQNRKPRVHRA
jgi:hypothetical protein